LVQVGVVIGSKTDEPLIQGCLQVLDSLNIDYEFTVLSAHRTPEKTMEYAKNAKDRGLQVLIAGAGGSAALPGTIASWTTLPVIGIPLPTSDIGGLDALYAIAQMPPGIPVAAVAIGAWGARNAAYLAAQILGLQDEGISQAYGMYRQSLKEG
jgi:5-(carboxyamino)imidazole ribonucleotide mutase